MHKVRSDILNGTFWRPSRIISFSFGLISTILSIPVFIESLAFISGSILFLVGIIIFSVLYYQYHSLENRINSLDQPYPADIIENFYQWEKGDKVEVPSDAGYHNALEGEYIGVGNDNSVIIKVDWGRKPKETISGKSVPRPKYYELPPNIFKFGYKNNSLNRRLRENEEERILNKLEDSYTDEVTERVKEEIEKERKRDELGEPKRPEEKYLKEYKSV